MSFFQVKESGVLLHVHVQPGSKRDELAGLLGGRLKVRLAAPPVDGKANAALINFVAKLFDIGKKDVSLVKGEKSRQKTLLVHGLSEELLLQTLPPITDISE